MFGLSNGEIVMDPNCPLEVKGQGQTLKPLKSNFLKTAPDREKVSIEVR